MFAMKLLVNIYYLDGLDSNMSRWEVRIVKCVWMLSSERFLAYRQLEPLPNAWAEIVNTKIGIRTCIATKSYSPGCCCCYYCHYACVHLYELIIVRLAWGYAFMRFVRIGMVDILYIGATLTKRM